MKILAVDDSKVVRKCIQAELTPAGYVLVEAADGHEALHVLSEQGDIRLVILDLEMPKMSGFDFLEALHRDKGSASVAVIILTSADTESNRLRGFELGAIDFLVKPFVKGELLSAVDAILKPHTLYRNVSALVIDDDPVCRAIVTSCLEQMGVNVFQADDGEPGWKLMQEHRNEINLVVTDLEMQGMNGDEVCRRTRTLLGLKELPILFLDVGGDAGKVIEIFRIGATDYLHKPFIKEELSARLRVHLERERLNRVLRRNVSELKTLGKLKDDFLAVCTHDLQAPMAAVGAAAEVLEMGDNLTDEQRMLLETIRSSVTTGSGLVRKLLDIRKAEAARTKTELTPQPIDEIARGCVETQKPAAGRKNLTLAFNNLVGDVMIRGNREDLVRVLNNLLSNAIKFTPNGGRVIVSVSKPRSDLLTLSVADTGIGIPADKLPGLFEKYTSASRQGTNGEASTGLGMSITKELVESNEGTIQVRSYEGVGTVFDVTFPALG